VNDIAWSPDGTKIAFSYKAPAAPSYDVAVVRADGRGPITFLTSDPEDDHNPALSPDGSKIAFVRGAVSGALTNGDVYVMNADGSNQTLYVDGSTSATGSSLVHDVVWSPDGTKLAYSQDVQIGDDEIFVVPAAAPGAPRPC
jgi:Tol biopolymer transport system component